MGHREIDVRRVIPALPGSGVRVVAGPLQVAGQPLSGYRADFDLTPAREGTEVRWHASFDAPPGFGWIYVAALRRFTRRLLDGLTRRLRDRAPTTP